MPVSLPKSTKVRILESLYSLDYLFFQKPASELSGICCPQVIKEYMTTKAAVLSVLIEMYSDMRYVASKFLTGSVPSSKSKLLEEAKMASDSAKLHAKQALLEQRTRKMIRESIIKRVSKMKNRTDSKVQKYISEKVEKVGLGLACDRLLLGRPISEQPEVAKYLSSKKGRLAFDAYKILRESLVEFAILIREITSENAK